jgi:hypothetical protein
MKRSSAASGPVQFKGARTPTKDLIATVAQVRADLKGKRGKSEAFHQMDSERLGRLLFDLKWRAQHGDAEAKKFVGGKS